ncbi:MAG: hypothetical protein H8E24_04410 [Verrucomicrobia bacterium]|nr:hypothetical protein [Verrucomicrobiota bacterium]
MLIFAAQTRHATPERYPTSVALAAEARSHWGSLNPAPTPRRCEERRRIAPRAMPESFLAPAANA